MFISAFHIDGFGIFSNVGCSELSPGLNIFFGKNEAGKSTCLEFFRSMLTGYPGKGSRRRYLAEPRGNSHPGGTLFLQCEAKPHELRLTRSPDALGGLRLYAADGSSLANDVLARLLSGIDREIYSRIFGFSLTELEQWDRASEESIRNALYGASFGPGLISPAEAEKNLQKRMGAIFKARGTSQPLAEAVRELKKIQSEIASLQAGRETYDALARDLAEIEEELARIRAEQHALTKESRSLERRLEQWQNQDALRSQRARLAAIEPVPDGLPEDAKRRLETLQNECAKAGQDLAAARAKLAQLEQRQADIVVNAQLLGELAELRSLAERKSSYRQARGQIDHLEQARQAIEEKLAADLAQLGPGWTCDKIRRTDRSLFARDGMDKLASAMNDAAVAHNSLTIRLGEANSRVEEADKRVRRLAMEIEELPAVEAVLDDREREELRRNRTRLEECRRLEPVRTRAWESARQASRRAIEQAAVFGSQAAEDEGEQAQLLATFLQHQEEATAMAGNIAECLKDSERAQAEERKAEEEAEEIKARLDSEINAQRAMGGQSREELDGRSESLRMLREVARNLQTEEERKKEIEARISQERQLAPMRNWTLVAFAFIFLAGAGAIFVAHWFFGVQEVLLAEGMAIPVNLWAAYAALVCGVILFASGFSAYGPEQKRRKVELAALASRNETLAMHIADLGQQADSLRNSLGLDAIDPISLEAMEVRIDREREQFFLEENAKRRIDELERERQGVVGRLAKLRKATQAKDAEVQQLRRRWHAFMQGLGAIEVPAPEGIGAIFARIENARAAEINAVNAQKELDALWEDLHLLEEQITSMPVIKEILESAPEALGLEQAVEIALSRCTEADRVLNRRNSLGDELESAQKQLADAEETQKKADEEVARSVSRLANAREDWESSLQGLGLATDMTPDTVRQAYKYMQDCLADEENLRRAERDLANCKSEIEAYEQPLGELVARIGGEPALVAGQPDWLASLDGLLQQAEESSRRQQRRESLAEDIADQQSELASIEARAAACDANLTALIEQAGARDRNHLLRLADARTERREIAARIRDLEAVLAQAAAGEPLERFLASFSDGDRDSQEARLAEIGASLEELAAREQEGIKKEAVLEKDIEQMEHASDLGEKRQQEEALKNEIADLSSQWCELALADALLKEAKSNFEKERQPEIIRTASEIFREITDSRWTGISLRLEDNSLVMLQEHGDPVPPEALSRGGQEQAWLAMRLAYILKHNQTGEPLPLIMDEVLVNFDPERARRSAEAFATLAQDGRQQILYFTCQPHMVEMLRTVFGQPALYNVVNGQISAATAA
ncbi:MAG: AAA family ATPase [Desulfovibrio sp.]|nr:AAA family ATPase [Desulfovibrio sp.]